MKAPRRQPPPPLGNAGIAGAAQVVFADYEDFLGGFPDLDAEQLKAFVNRHAAARAALTHYEQLLKLAVAAGDPDQRHEVAALRDAAQAGLAATASDEAAAHDD